MNLFFWFFLVLFIVAGMQDLKRREVDNWLNLFIYFSGFIYVLYKVFLYNEITFLFNFAFLTFFMFFLAYVFYYARIFAGGDCKLLFAATPLLVSLDFVNSFMNAFLFSVSLLFLGAIYGLFWIFGLFFKDFKKNNKEFIVLFKKNKILFFSIVFVFLIGLVNYYFLVFSLLSFFMFFVFLVSKSVEKNSLVRLVNYRDLREGDWLDKKLVVKGKVLKPNFDGLSLQDIEFLRKHKKSVFIKDGIPFAPVFVFAWIFFSFQGVFMEFLASLLVI